MQSLEIMSLPSASSRKRSAGRYIVVHALGGADGLSPPERRTVDSYEEALSEFYAVYNELLKSYDLKYRRRTSLYKVGVIEIWRRIGRDWMLIVKRESEDDDENNLRRATDDLKMYHKWQQDKLAKIIQLEQKKEAICS